MNAIELEHVDFAYTPTEPILKDINLRVPTGSIFGFLGPNGVGKTTTLKLILSLLLNKSQGRIKVMGHDTKKDYPDYLQYIGSMIEEASVYSHLRHEKI